MGNFIPAAKAGELADGTMKEVMVQGHPILLARVGDRYYAADGRCPHMDGVLAQGKLEGTMVTCPRHSSQFDLTDGHVVRWLKGSGLISAIGRMLKSPKPLTVYPVKVEKDDILVEI
jgi:3-phenylpropionate/trans-cinnamate dioxygenase ferredoxin subunit